MRALGFLVDLSVLTLLHGRSLNFWMAAWAIGATQDLLDFYSWLDCSGIWYRICYLLWIFGRQTSRSVGC